MKYFILSFLIFKIWIYGKSPLKDVDIESFIEARYGGDTSIVRQIIDENFLYYHAPYIGLGIDGHYVDGSFIVSSVLYDSTDGKLGEGDRIFELNGVPIDSSGLKINGPAGEEQRLIVNKKNDSTFTELKIPLKEYQYKQNKISFLNNINDYAAIWYDYDIEIIDLVLKKNKAVIHYYWEGSKREGGSVYSFTAMEFITLNKKRNLVMQIVSLWSEKQFRDQFK